MKYAQVKVEYESEGLKNLTGYALGQQFDPGTVRVTVELDQQEGGPGGQSVDRVENTAKAQITYRPWNSTGSKEAEVTQNRRRYCGQQFRAAGSAECIGRKSSGLKQR